MRGRWGECAAQVEGGSHGVLECAAFVVRRVAGVLGAGDSPHGWMV